MVIEQGNYDSFKRCTFRLLDYGRIAGVVQALHDWTVVDKLDLTFISEEYESASAVLRFNYRFPEGKTHTGVFDYFYLRAKTIDTVLWQLKHDGVVLFDRRESVDNHWRFPVGRDGGSGEVAFLVEVPYPCLLDDETNSRCAER